MNRRAGNRRGTTALYCPRTRLVFACCKKRNETERIVCAFNKTCQAVFRDAELLSKVLSVRISYIIQLTLRIRVYHHVTRAKRLYEFIRALCAPVFKFIQIMSATLLIERI